jgi:hypothetical protein
MYVCILVTEEMSINYYAFIPCYLINGDIEINCEATKHVSDQGVNSITSNNSGYQNVKRVHLCLTSTDQQIIWDLEGLEYVYNLVTGCKLEILKRKDKNGLNKVCFVDVGFRRILDTIGEQEEIYFQSESGDYNLDIYEFEVKLSKYNSFHKEMNDISKIVLLSTSNDNKSGDTPLSNYFNNRYQNREYLFLSQDDPIDLNHPRVWQALI